MSIPLISIVTGTRHRPDSYARFISSVRKTTKTPYEIVVGDANDCSIAESYAKPATDIRVLYQRPRMGMIKGYNHAFAHCRGEWVVWFNDDVECLPNWDTEALAFMKKYPQVGIGAIYFLDSNGRKQVQTLEAQQIVALKGPERYAEGWNTQFCIQTLYHVPYANFGFQRRSLGEELGWFPEDIGQMYGSDTDFSFSAIMQGYYVAGIPKARVLHYRNRDEEREQNRYLIVDDRQRFDAKWVPVIKELQDKFNSFGIRSEKGIP